MRVKRSLGEGASRRAGWRRVAAIAAMATVLVSANPVLADNYDDSNAGHPFRIAAYLLHPVGVMIDYLFMRPAHWVVSREPMKTIFGHED